MFRSLFRFREFLYFQGFPIDHHPAFIKKGTIAGFVANSAVANVAVGNSSTRIIRNGHARVTRRIIILALFRILGPICSHNILVSLVFFSKQLASCIRVFLLSQQFKNDLLSQFFIFTSQHFDSNFHFI